MGKGVNRNKGNEDRGDTEGGREIVRPRALTGGPGKSPLKYTGTSENLGQIRVT